MIPRTLTTTILKNQRDGFINIIYGPRRVGKTTMLTQIVKDKKGVLWVNGDTEEGKKMLATTSGTMLSALVRDHNTIVVDEAQRIENIGLSLKILVDKFPQKTFYVSGSSSLLLARGAQETLTGRNLTYKLYPLTTTELTQGKALYQKTSILPQQLIYGGYPYTYHLTNNSDRKRYLTALTKDYLFKDITELKGLIKPENLRKLTILLAFQIGSEVSQSELANTLEVDKKTVSRYIELLKQSFVIFELGSFSRNLRKEVAKSKKYFFWDLGIRNALINQFQPLNSRVDKGALWENFLAMERIKKNEYQQVNNNYYFWRTYDQSEIDWIEEREGKLFAYEFKWKKKQAKTPKLFWEQYRVKTQTINQENYLSFVEH